MAEPVFRVMTRRDIDFAVGLVRLAGWGNPRRDLERAIQFEPGGCFVAALAGEDVGIICSFLYGETGFIGNVIVHPDHRGRGVGEAMMRHAVERLEREGARCIKLDSVEKAVSLYRRLGFKPRSLSLRFAGVPEPGETGGVERLKPQDVPAAAALDREYFRHDRADRLALLQEDYPDLCLKAVRRGVLSGFIMARRGTDAVRVGPWICRPAEPQAAEALFSALAGKVPGERIWVGVPEGNAASARMLEAHGMPQLTPSLRMCYGECAVEERVEGIFAIGAPDKG